MARKARLIPPVWGLACVVVIAVVCILVIPIPRPAFDFSAFVAGDSDGTTVFRETRWYELVPQGWDPNQEARRLQQGLRGVGDTDPRAIAMLQKLRNLWDDAPINRALDGAAVRLPGYVVPLEASGRGLQEFLLVPYFGACIHSPPPPSNQIVHVRLQRPVPGVHAMDTVWISGTLRGERSDSRAGISSYAMDAVAVEQYVPGAR